MQQLVDLTEARGVTQDRADALRMPASKGRAMLAGEWVLRPHAVILADLLTVGSIIAALGRVQGSFSGQVAYAAALVGVALLSILILRRRRLWSVGVELSVLDEVPGLLVAGVFSPVAVYFITSLVAPNVLDPWTFGVLGLALAGGLVFERAVLRAFQRSLRRRGIGLRNTLIIGAGTIGSLISRRLLFNPDLGLRPVGFLDKEPLIDSAERLGLPVLGNSRDLSRVIYELDVGMVVVAFSTAPHEVLLRIVTTCQERGVALAVVPRLFETITHPGMFERLRGIPVIGVGPIRLSGGLWWTKRAVDFVASSALLALFGPLLAVLAVLVKLDSPGPIFYKQERTGRDGRLFQMVKFRTMAVDAEERQGGAMWSDEAETVAGSSYVTRMGRFLRKSSLDELPQLLNVVQGDMSLIGPRPERPVFVNRFVHDVYRYGDRTRVKAGMTGWAQVHGLKGNHGSLSERVEYDNFYIENWSPWLDTRILLLTIQQIYRDLRGLT